MIDTYITITDDEGQGEVKCFIYVNKISYVQFGEGETRIVMDNGHVNTVTNVSAEKKAHLIDILKGAIRC